jgi:N-succinyldiaminopimelate aminotransferase
MPVSRLKDIPGIGVDQMGNAADAAHDPEILRLENMDTDIPPPPEALDATRAAVGRDDCNSYLPFTGQNDLRQAATEHVSRLSGVAYDWESQCVITAGGLSGILNTLLALLEPGDQVLLHDPIYAGLVNRVRLASGVPKFIPLEPTSGGWAMDRSALQSAGKARVVLMVNPSFPTGAHLTREDWESIAEYCQRNDCWLLYDAALERILFDGKPYFHPASLPGMAERTITVGCVTKEYRMIGWRVGWVVGPRTVMTDLALVGLTNVCCQVGITMPGAAAALRLPDSVVHSAVAEWQRRRDATLAEISDLPAVRPDGGWCLLLNTRKLGLDPAAASQSLLAKGKVAATPMTHWGSTRAADYLRFVYANEPVERLRGLRDRIRQAWQL